jgi:TM2 domain-containing membrane protein YozV
MTISKFDLTDKELLVLNSALRDSEKSLAIGYLMLIGGHLGVHRFYLKRVGTAITQLVLFLAATVSYLFLHLSVGLNNEAGIITSVIGLLLTALPLFIWIIVDLFLLPGMIREWNSKAEEDILNQIIQYRQK